MKEYVVRYVNGPLQGVGSISVPDEATEPPLRQRIPLPVSEPGLRRTMSEAYGRESHAVYERAAYNANEEWEYQLVRIE